MGRDGVVRMVAAFAAAALIAALPSLAREPDGYMALRYAWPDGPPAPGREAVLRVSVEAVVWVQGLVARFAAHSGVGFRKEAGAPLTETGATEIGALDKGGRQLIELLVRAPEKGGGIVAFRVVGERNGVRFEEGFGLPVGQVGVEPRLRDGAWEFPSEAAPTAGP